MKQLLVIAVLLLGATLFILFQSSQPQTKTRPANPYKVRLVDSVEQYFQQAVDNGWVVGAAVALVNEESIIYLGGFGHRDVSQADTVDQHTVFRIGSLSKGFAGILAATLVEEEKLDWATTVDQYLPEFQLHPTSATDKVTLQHLLSHTAGFPYHTYTNLVEAGLPLSTIATRMKDVPLVDAPGKLYSYQNAAFALSGELLSRALKQPFDSLLYQRLFRPLQMHHASTSLAALQSATNIAYPHRRRNGQWQRVELNDKYYNAIAAGGINASIEDMAKWLQSLLGQNPQVISPATLQATFEPLIATKDHNRYYHKWKGHLESYYGKGWRIHTFEGNDSTTVDTLIHHGGQVNNYRSEIAIHPQSGIGICVLFNAAGPLSQKCIPFCLSQFHSQIDSIQNWELLQRN